MEKKKKEREDIFANAPQAITLIPSNERDGMASNPMSNITNYPADKDSAAHCNGNCASVPTLVRTLGDMCHGERHLLGSN